MPYILIVTLALSLVWLSLELRKSNESVQQLSQRLTALEISQDTLSKTQEQMSEEWSQVFSNTEKSWDKHVTRITNQVTTELALGQSARQRNRR